MAENNIQNDNDEDTIENTVNNSEQDNTLLENDTSVEQTNNILSVDDTREETNIELEKYKLKINFFKWVLGTFIITIITIAINWGFKDREKGMEEIASYYQYATELIIKNNDPIKKRMVAQFYANVTPSYFLRRGWKNYYEEVNKEYLDYMYKNDSLRNLLDSFRRKYSDTSQIKNQKDKNEFLHLVNAVKEYEDVIKTPIVLPNDNYVPNQPKVYIQYSGDIKKEDAKKIQQSFNNINWLSPSIELVEGKYGKSIRYFNVEDSTIASGAQKLLGDSYKIIPIISTNNRIPKGQIEVWMSK